MERTGSIGVGVERAVAALTGRRAFWIALVAAAASWPFAWSLTHAPHPAPPVLGPVPPFSLLDEEGRRFGTADLAGRVWLAGPVTTQLGSSSHATGHVTARMARIQERARQLGPTFHLVSLALDDEQDTPERLRAYARAHRASPRLWSFVSGQTGELRRALRDAAVRPSAGGAAVAPCSAEVGLFLVDEGGRLRACYDATREEAVDLVLRDVGALVNAARPAAPAR